MELAVVEFEDRLEDIHKLVEKYDHPMMPVFSAVAAGAKIISLRETLRRSGFNEQGLPKLALSSNKGRVARFDNDGDRYRLDSGWLSHPLFGHKIFSAVGYRSECPPVPNKVLELYKDGDLWCWEVARWERVPRQALGDPVLLRPLYEDYHAVIAEWDLTDLERELFSKV